MKPNAATRFFLIMLIPLLLNRACRSAGSGLGGEGDASGLNRV